MNTEEKARAYDEALEKAKEWMDEREQMIYPREIVENIFPQLAESEDEKIRTRLIALVEAFGQGKYKDEIAWLKLLRNRVGKEFLQPHWKPSEEQMNALYNIIYPCDYVGKVALESLYNDLKKL